MAAWLLAMPRSGEIYLATDENGVTWIFHPEGAGDPDLIEPDKVDETLRQACGKHSWELVRQDFGSWEEIQAARQRMVGAWSDQMGRHTAGRAGAADAPQAEEA